MTLLPIQKRHRVMSTSNAPLLKILRRAKTIICIENKLEVRSLRRLGVVLAVGMAQYSLSGWLELFICSTKKWRAACRGLMCFFCPELKAVAASENIFDEIWHYTAISCTVSFSQGCQFTGRLNELIRMKEFHKYIISFTEKNCFV
jgi:hypothetical protein